MFLLFLVTLLLVRRKVSLSDLKERSKAQKTQLGLECCKQQHEDQLEFLNQRCTPEVNSETKYY